MGVINRNKKQFRALSLAKSEPEIAIDENDYCLHHVTHVWVTYKTLNTSKLRFMFAAGNHFEFSDNLTLRWALNGPNKFREKGRIDEKG